MVINAFASISGLIKARLSGAEIDNFVFRLHYRWTGSFCFIASALVVSSGFIGNAIHCIDPDSYVTTYCWVTSTFSLYAKGNLTLYPNFGDLYDGLGAYNEKIHDKRFHSYYQWVPIILFLQGCLFYFPHLLWKSREGQLAETLLQELHLAPLDNEWPNKTKNIARYLNATTGEHKHYFYSYLVTEILNFVNVVSQIFLLDLFLGGRFLNYGVKVISNHKNTNPMEDAFPRVVGCDFLTFGPSGTRETRGILCILPENLLNEKIFIILWVWFVSLALITGVQLIIRLLLEVLPNVRTLLLEQRGKLQSSVELKSLLGKMDRGDFFLLNILSKNLNSLYFKDVLKQLIYEEPKERKRGIGPHAHILHTYKPFNKGLDLDWLELK